MKLSYDFVQQLQNLSPEEAWAAIFEMAWEVCSQAIDVGKEDAEVAKRDRLIGELDHYLATAGWDLWRDYESSVSLTSDTLAQWWNDQSTSGVGSGRAVLILDGLSLRETPWLLAGAAKHGLKIVNARPTGAELPADTTPFAKSLGFSQRSALGNNGAGGSHKLNGAKTDCTDIAWQDCATLVGSEPSWVFWHQWPDCQLHDHDDPGQGLSALTANIVQHLTGDAFWKLVSRLAEGRRLVITSDHGYAASGLFPDSDKDQTEYLKSVYKSGRWDASAQPAGAWAPPIDLQLTTRHGTSLFVNGRRKWKSAGGYPTLTHGGLTVLEVAVPFIEISK
jgi:hypothetical protein